MSIRIVTFDVYNTLIRYTDKLRSEVASNVAKYFNKLGYEVSYNAVLEFYLAVEREVKAARTSSMALSPPAENVRQLLMKVAKKYGIRPSDRYISDLLNVISDTVINSVNMSPIEGASEALAIFKEEGWRVGLVSNVVFWPGKASRAVLNRFGLEKYIDYGVFADEVGYAKPHPYIFDTAVTMLAEGREPDVVMHVGDNFAEDFAGALMSGAVAVLYDEEGEYIRGAGSPLEAIKCRGYVIRKTMDSTLVPHMLDKC
ncbi:2-haloalkanoic acid dehalogenase [Thermocladium modestius]|uniref:2-haloalkanoic acid dehalogenase n=1 Tax=Thermocladium modestius TaxID=62609 RepID=A0A830GQZ5_9CREN|nr:HAD family hydrolase [Thermocladium modestius]GGP19141.1 2-haloalkanoic acid dehalogenase [Thermocladium modestius]